jgi:histidinol-phosphate/aromatic aminotransferase/cobyric acid decarboxylase-like protein
LNSPSNPTGAMWPRHTIEALAEIAVRRDFFVISDEIYEKITYDDNQPVSIAALGPEIKKRTITVNGVSKTYSMTGWRIGYAAAEAEIVGAMGRIQDSVTSNPTSIAPVRRGRRDHRPAGVPRGMGGRVRPATARDRARPQRDPRDLLRHPRRRVLRLPQRSPTS